MELTENQKLIRDLLIKGAKSDTPLMDFRDVVTGANLTNEYDIDQDLCEISRYEFMNGRPMLSCVVVDTMSDNMPRDEFFKLAESLYGLDFEHLGEVISFFAEEFKKTSDYWKNIA